MSQDEPTTSARHGAQGSGSAPSQPQGGRTSSSTPLIPRPDQLPGTLTLQERKKVSATNDIYRGLWAKPSGETVPVIIKVVQKAWFQSEKPPSLTGEERFERRIARETSIWHTTRHEHILQFIGYQLIDGAPFLVSPVCAHGDLRGYISRNPHVGDIERLTLLLDATRGLAYLHSLHPPIAHGSIHPSDILVTDDFRGVLCDFGDSRVVTHLQTGFTTALYSFHRVRFSSPELIKGSTFPTPMSDVYGLGGTILWVMTGKDPFHQKRTLAQVVLAIANGIVPDPSDHCELPEPLWKLMGSCWKADPSQRSTAARIVYKINLILEFGHGLTAPFRRPVVASSAPPGPDEPDVKPEDSMPSLPAALPGTLAMGERIGGGGYGEVHRGSWTPPGKDPIPVAIKCLKIGRTVNLQALDIKRIRRETVIWKVAEHPNILRFYGHQIVNESPMLISSWCKNGDLSSFLAENAELTRRERLKLLCGAGRGLAHLHSLQPPICHGDIKPQNVIISDNMEALLCDFGISRILADPGITGMTTQGLATCTYGFGSKEILAGESGPSEKGDVYAFGGLILATMTGKRPFYTQRNHHMIMLAILTDQSPKPADYPELISTDSLWTLMEQCWDPEPAQRPLVSQIVAELQGEIDRLYTLGQL
ncbi:hypothetical protein M407DRAFT_19350 [Tulasnella calospora MUT 4182]|uniref:Protein kinase domain-containing protein n=1 Tax=Tulasnella calospora MUT 4182 TaxID=1051891 RepID=A0A0C3MCV1_9AGAM|nr:hypothetical protein M407DRAFT_19350 [Tulasnella calospora MUT 4182]